MRTGEDAEGRWARGRGVGYKLGGNGRLCVCISSVGILNTTSPRPSAISAVLGPWQAGARHPRPLPPPQRAVRRKARLSSAWGGRVCPLLAGKCCCCPPARPCPWYRGPSRPLRAPQGSTRTSGSRLAASRTPNPGVGRPPTEGSLRSPHGAAPISSRPLPPFTRYCPGPRRPNPETSGEAHDHRAEGTRSISSPGGGRLAERVLACGRRDLSSVPPTPVTLRRRCVCTRTHARAPARASTLEMASSGPSPCHPDGAKVTRPPPSFFHVRSAHITFQIR